MLCITSDVPRITSDVVHALYHWMDEVVVKIRGLFSQFAVLYRGKSNGWIITGTIMLQRCKVTHLILVFWTSTI